MFTAESTLLPNIRKTASSSKVNNENTETSTSYTPETSYNGADANLAYLPNGKAYVGVTSYLSLRDEPFGKIIARLYNNDEIVIVNRDGDWYEVESDKGSGWVYGKCVYDSPNTNPQGSTSETVSKTDEEDDDDDDLTSNKSNGIYYYFNFDDPGDYKITIATNNNESTSKETNNTSTNKQNSEKQTTKKQSTDNKNIKTKPVKTSTVNNKSSSQTKTKANKSGKKTKREEAIDLCYECAWGPKAKRSQYGYPNGKRKEKYVQVLQKVYGKRKGWGRQTKMGASCDVATAAILRYFFDKKFTRGCDHVISYLNSNRGKKYFKQIKERNWKKWKPFTVIFSKYKSGGKHIFIYVGDGWVYNAHYCKKTYPRIEKVTKIYKSAKKCKRTIVFVPKALD